MAEDDAQDSPAGAAPGRLARRRQHGGAAARDFAAASQSAAPKLDPGLLVAAYRAGVFPMDGPDGLHWYRPEPRALIPLDDRFHVPASLARVVRQGRFVVSTDVDFEGVMRGCAARDETWISEALIAAYVALHRHGCAHSVECRDASGTLVGGLYGVALGGAFFGESMFSTARDASKVALVHLVARLRRGGFALLDTQFMTPHLARFGAFTVPRRVYEGLLAGALAVPARWDAPDPDAARAA